MLKLRDPKPYEEDIENGAAAFRDGKGICECDRPGSHGDAFQIGWLNECQAAVHDLMGEAFGPAECGKKPAKGKRKKVG